MHEQPIDDRAAQEKEREADALFMLLALAEGDEPVPIAMLVRTLGGDDEMATLQAVERLRAGGLAHRIEHDHVMPTRAALYFDQIMH